MSQVGFIVLDLLGTTLSAAECELLKHPAVAGIILFSRNYENIVQLRELTATIKKIRDDLLIAVDHEGGRVQRFREGFTQLPSMRYFGELSQQQPEQARWQLQQTIKTAAKELKSMGVHLNFTPVLDIDYGYNQVIGERSFGNDSALVITLGKIVIDALHEAGMPAIGKHFPGHGGVSGDSHHTLPIDARERHLLRSNDLLPFVSLLPELDAIMPAHIIYTAFDSYPAGFSRYWLNDVLRQQLNYEGVVISDDLSMKGAAAMGSYAERALLALEAGCDLLMVCNNREGTIAVLDALANYQNPVSLHRIMQFKKKVGTYE